MKPLAYPCHGSWEGRNIDEDRMQSGLVSTLLLMIWLKEEVLIQPLLGSGETGN